MPYLRREGSVFVLYLGNEDEEINENRFHPTWLKAMNALLDEVEASEGSAALVTTNTGKFYTNGLDTEYVFSHGDQLPAYLDEIHELYARLLAFPMATVAALRGHAFGGGAMLALAHDFRVMRADRGYWCLPEVTLNMPFTFGMNQIVTDRLPKQTAIAAMTTGRQFGGVAALEAGIVDATAAQGEELAAAVQMASALVATRGANLAGIKRGIHADILAALAKPTAETGFAFG
jgi:enoyl-CoA hydratase/carnithine racemase